MLAHHLDRWPVFDQDASEPLTCGCDRRRVFGPKLLCGAVSAPRVDAFVARLAVPRPDARRTGPLWRWLCDSPGASIDDLVAFERGVRAPGPAGLGANFMLRSRRRATFESAMTTAPSTVRRAWES